MRRSSSATGYPWPPWGALAPPATAGGPVAVGAVSEVARCGVRGAVLAGRSLGRGRARWSSPARWSRRGGGGAVAAPAFVVAAAVAVAVAAGAGRRRRRRRRGRVVAARRSPPPAGAALGGHRLGRLDRARGARAVGPAAVEVVHVAGGRA